MKRTHECQGRVWENAGAAQSQKEITFLLRNLMVDDVIAIFQYLRNRVTARDDGQNATLLNGRRFFKTVRVNAAQQFLLQAHVVETG